MTAPELKPTPRTDGEECEFVPSANPYYDGPYKWVESSFARQLERELDAAQARALPDGWVVVPKESTPEMERAYRLAYARYITDLTTEYNQGKILKAAHQYAYDSMLAAAHTETGGKDEQ